MHLNLIIFMLRKHVQIRNTAIPLGLYHNSRHHIQIRKTAILLLLHQIRRLIQIKYGSRTGILLGYHHNSLDYHHKLHSLSYTTTLPWTSGMSSHVTT